MSNLRQLGESGAHVVMAVRKPKAAQELIQKWQDEWSGIGLHLNIEVIELDLLSLESVVRFSKAWNSRMGPLHVLINNAEIFSIGGIGGPKKAEEEAKEKEEVAAKEKEGQYASELLEVKERLHALEKNVHEIAAVTRQTKHNNADAKDQPQNSDPKQISGLVSDDK